MSFLLNLFASPRVRHVFHLGVSVIGALVVATLLVPRIHPKVELKRFAVVPSFSLTERSGKTITNHDLDGKIYVADFIYTTCPGPCPVISAAMARLQKKLAGDSRVQLVSFTVDPKDDTPPVLAAYASRFDADPQKWWFLTGPQAQVFDLIQNGFMQTLQDHHGQPLEPSEFLVLHSTYMVLVDAHGFIRGFYGGLDADDQASLWEDIHQLEQE
jgi:cytochrome oxidase Cu insertion factor (SCO1/SenC/PrrC family)